MSSQDPVESTVPPERPKNPTHFGGEGLYERAPDAPQNAAEQYSQDSLWEFAKRYHVPSLLAAGGIAWLLVSLVRRSMQRW